MQFNKPFANQTNAPYYPQNPNNYNQPIPQQNINNANIGNYQPGYSFVIPNYQNPNTFNIKTNVNNNYNGGNQPNNFNFDYRPEGFMNPNGFGYSPFAQNLNQLNNLTNSNNFNGFALETSYQLSKFQETGNTLNVNVDYKYFGLISPAQQREIALKKQKELKMKKQNYQLEKRQKQEEKRLKQEEERREKEEEARDKQFEARKLERQFELKQNEAQLNIFADYQRQELDRGSGRFSNDFGMKGDFGQNNGQQFSFQSPEQVNNSLLRFSKKAETNQKHG